MITPEFIIDTLQITSILRRPTLSAASGAAKSYSRARSQCICAANGLDAPLTGIGKMMGDRDHTTVMHGIEKIEKEMSAKDSVRNTVDILKKKINPSK